MIPSSDFCRLVLCFRVDDPDAKTPLGAKFGCSIPQGKSLLSMAKDHRLNVIGVRYMRMYNYADVRGMLCIINNNTFVVYC